MDTFQFGGPELDDIVDEARHGIDKHGTFHSLHEGFGVLYEEVDELWEEVRIKRSRQDPQNIYHEAMQVAALALRIMVEFGKRGH